MWSADFADVEALQAAGDWAVAGELLADAARKIERAGAELLVLCTNTMHRVAGPVQAAVSIPLLHIGDVTAEAVAAAGLERVGLFGTRYTMEADFLRDRIAAGGIEVLVPPEPQRELVHDVIYDELVRGVVRDASRRHYQEIIGALVADGAPGGDPRPHRDRAAGRPPGGPRSAVPDNPPARRRSRGGCARLSLGP